MLKVKVPHLDRDTKSKTIRILQNIFLTLMQALGIITVSIGLWLLLRLCIGVNCQFLSGFYSAPILMLVSGVFSIIISTVVIVMLQRSTVIFTIQQYVLMFTVVIVLELASCINASTDHYFLNSKQFKLEVQKDFNQFYNNPDKDFSCWRGLQKKFRCCGEKNAMDWINMTKNASSTLYIKQGLESCECDEKEKKKDKVTCTDISNVSLPFNSSIISIYSSACYASMLSFLEYQCIFLKIFGPCLIFFQVVNFFLTAIVITKMTRQNAVRTVYMVDVDDHSRHSNSDFKTLETSAMAT